MNTWQVALLSVLIALCFGLQLTPRPPNVEFTSLISFTVGVAFGSWFGGILGASVMFVNGFLSPYGLSGPLVLFQAAGMSLIGFAGGGYSKTVTEGKGRWMPVEVAILGAFLTLTYDIITNVGYALQFSLLTNSFIVSFIGVLVAGSVFMAIHVASNTILFTTSVPIVKGIQKLLGR
jgi:hypothetical protein